MYGYSWLKPAGCNKTMLGRREEEIEREEVEGQLREVEMQERNAAEAEEEERGRRQREMQERGEVVPEGERDLDDDVPEADQTQQTVEEEGEGMEGDLDDDVPDADDDEEEEEEDEDDDEVAENASGSGFGEGWTYDSRREPDSDDEEGTAARLARFAGRPPPGQRTQGVNRAAVARAAAALGISHDSEYGYGVDEREAAALADAMLDEDELGEFDLDAHPGDDVEARDLDEEVPDADEGGWEHTDTELEESEMDISILPGQPILPPTGSRRSSARAGARVVSGNAARFAQQQQMQRMHQTPNLDQTSALLSSSSAMAASESSAIAGNEAAVQGNRRNWLNAAGTSARRNLFGNTRLGRGAAAGGGLFTPSPRQEMEGSPEGEAEGDANGTGQGHRRRRSGRLLAGMGVGRRRENRDSVD